MDSLLLNIENLTNVDLELLQRRIESVKTQRVYPVLIVIDSVTYYTREELLDVLGLSKDTFTFISGSSYYIKIETVIKAERIIQKHSADSNVRCIYITPPHLPHIHLLYGVVKSLGVTEDANERIRVSEYLQTMMEQEKRHPRRCQNPNNDFVCGETTLTR
jgi:hypothetical protein